MLNSGAFFLPLRLEVRAPVYKGLPEEHNHRFFTFVSVTIATEASQRQQGAVLPLAWSCLFEVLLLFLAAVQGQIVRAQGASPF